MNDEKTVFHTIGGKEFYVPTALQYDQYYQATQLLTEHKIEFGENVNVELLKAEAVNIVMQAGKIIGDLIKFNIVPDFFAIVLIPKDYDEWDKKFIEENREIMYKITDVQMLEVFSDFLANKKPLILGLMEKWKGFRSDTKLSKTE